MVIKGRTQLINYIIEENRYKSYAEIGTSNPHVHFDYIKCDKKYSIDPGEDCENWGDKTQQFKFTHKMTSDEFFAQNTETFDCIFIDGLHTDLQCSLDVFNALKVINDKGTIVIHDTMPESPEMTGDEVRKFNWQGNCWMPVYRILTQLDDWLMTMSEKLREYIEIKTFYLDWGISCIKILKPLDDWFLNIMKEILIDNPEELQYEGYEKECSENTTETWKGFSTNDMHPCYDAAELIHDKVSYFTPLYKTNVKILKKVYIALCAQTLDKWEWVVVDDSPTDELRIFFDTISDFRVKYYRFSQQSGGRIGEAKWRCTTLCTGKYLAELDHDDIILPEMTERILKLGNKYNADFIYCDAAEVYYDEETDAIRECKRYGEGFGMGYESYYQKRIQNPVNKGWYTVQAIKSALLNPKTLRHIVGVPNHIRCWRKDFYFEKLDGHRRMLPIADDYELVVKTVVLDGTCVHMNWCGYLQTLHETNATDVHRPLIQEYVKAVRAKWDYEIEHYFNVQDKEHGDWCRKHLKEHLKNDTRLYHAVPNFKTLYPGKEEPTYPKLIELFEEDF